MSTAKCLFAEFKKKTFSLLFFLCPPPTPNPPHPPVCIQAASSHAAVSMAISICVRNSLTLYTEFHVENPT